MSKRPTTLGHFVIYLKQREAGFLSKINYIKTIQLCWTVEKKLCLTIKRLQLLDQMRLYFIRTEIVIEEGKYSDC